MNLFSDCSKEGIHTISLVYLEEIDQEYRIETVDAEYVEDGYRLISIPFFAKHLALGDVISVETEDGIHYFEDIIAKSGHSVIRLVFWNRDIIESTIQLMQDYGSRAFRYQESELVAFDIAPSVQYKTIKAFLDDGARSRSWDYEEACLGWK
ncbi:DUF4265 domain-containing protein [Hymenobacter metallicola]|uniref:DUF4265 domain-containing protein n=1 Tax=Hymenobacter metallicola TaxID=2563114 RepID=A0A4Z0QFW3_9BACT|nr:DUF4265 domain-containing protein [Hymenobacter metallicola]TGE28644.1 DUF4265 domain-containing protein [Hymenobacter metallicola]